ETSVNDCHSRRGDGSDNRGTRHWDLRQKRSEPFVSPPGPIDPDPSLTDDRFRATKIGLLFPTILPKRSLKYFSLPIGRA
ncbi:MAG: hypothetical protein JWN63_3302, partial [Candidatus Acidoferrum typicum]|nr:hypothetical protein [Candidatus Acidoferrum typicum]